jgi:cysteine synthase B
VDRILEVTQPQVEAMTRALAAREGVFAGISSGGVVHSALEVCRGLKEGVVVCIICDRGDRYLSASVFG